MAKRLTDTDKWRKPFIKSLPLEYKLIWFYILDDCDHAGVWHCEMDVASIRLGFPVNEKDILDKLQSKVVKIDKEKFFIPSFILFQYGRELSCNNRMHASVIGIVNKYSLHEYIEAEGIVIVDEGTSADAMRKRLTNRIKLQVYSRDEFTCQYCSKQHTKEDLVVDHILPISKGGDNTLQNLATACRKCNSLKSDFTLIEFFGRHEKILTPTDPILKFLEAAKETLQGAYNNLYDPKDKSIYKDKVTVKDKGGVGENWNKNPLAIDHFDLTETEINLSIEFISRIKQKNLTPSAINEFWKGFMIQYFNGEKYYQSRTKCIEHFRNWLKEQKYETNERNNKPDAGAHQGKSASKVSAIENLGRKQAS